MRRAWTAGERGRLVRLARAGWCADDIADELDRTNAAVRTMANDLGVRFPRRTEPNYSRRAELLDLLAATPGAPLAACARAMRCTPQSVCGMATKLVREGLLERVGGRCRAGKYLVTDKWRTDAGRVHRARGRFPRWRGQ